MYEYCYYDRWNLKTELEHMERIDSDIMERTLSYYHQFDFSTFTPPQMFKTHYKRTTVCF